MAQENSMDNKKSSLATTWRMVGWILAVVAIAVVAGPQILDLFVSVDPD